MGHSLGLEVLGLAGVLAVKLFRAQKASERAKVYRGSRFKGAAYDRKQWSMDNLCAAPTSADELDIAWGWGEEQMVRLAARRILRRAPARGRR